MKKIICLIFAVIFSLGLCVGCEESITSGTIENASVEDSSGENGRVEEGLDQSQLAVLTFKYVEEDGNGNLTESSATPRYTFIYEFELGHVITKEEYDKIYKEVTARIPNNLGGYYTFDGFYSTLQISLPASRNNFYIDFEVTKSQTFYFTWIGGELQPPTGTFTLTVIDESNFLTDLPSDSKILFCPSQGIILHSQIIMDADLGFYLENGLLYSGITRALPPSETESGFDEWEYELDMWFYEDVTLIFKPISQYHSSELFNWQADLADYEITSIKKEDYHYGVAPGSFTSIKVSESASDIQAVIDYLQVLFMQDAPLAETSVDGGGGATLTIYTNQGEFGLTQSNGFIYVDGKYYEASQKMPEVTEYQEYYGFVTYKDVNTMYIAGEKYKEYGNILGEIVFIGAESSNVPIVNFGYNFILENGFEVRLLSPKHFLFENQCYYVVSDIDFTQIFDDYTSK